MKIKHVLECQFGEWYNKWKEVSITSVILPLPADFVHWLRSEQFITGADGFPLREQPSEMDSDFYQHVDENSSVEERKFPELCDEIDKHIKALGGSVFPKLNWSAPQDAIWMNTNHSTKCDDSSEVIIMLKSSDFIMRDITEAFIQCEDSSAIDQTEISYYLVLRKWENIEPSREFRCFVSHNQLVGISQRNIQQHFAFLSEEKTGIQKKIEQFFESHIRNQFSTHAFVFDIAFIRNRIRLVDFNVFGKITDPLLFSWEELFLMYVALESDGSKKLEVDFRIIDNPIHIQPSISSFFGKPIDAVDVSSFDGMLELIRIQKQQEKEASDQ